MIMRRCRTIVSVASLVLMPVPPVRGPRAIRAAFGCPTAGSTPAGGYGVNASGGHGHRSRRRRGSHYGYGVRNGQVGTAYRSAGRPLRSRATAPGPRRPSRSGRSTAPSPRSRVGRPSTRRRDERARSTRPSAPRTPPTTVDGKILWPSTSPTTPRRLVFAAPPTTRGRPS